MLSRVVLPVPVAPDTAMAIPAATMASSSLASGVEGVPVDQVAELEPSPGEGADGEHRAVGGERREHRMEPLAPREAGVDPGPRLVHPEPERGDHPLDQGGHGGGRGEADGGPLDGAATLHPRRQPGR